MSSQPLHIFSYTIVFNPLLLQKSWLQYFFHHFLMCGTWLPFAGCPCFVFCCCSGDKPELARASPGLPCLRHRVFFWIPTDVSNWVLLFFSHSESEVLSSNVPSCEFRGAEVSLRYLSHQRCHFHRRLFLKHFLIIHLKQLKTSPTCCAVLQVLFVSGDSAYRVMEQSRKPSISR